jgi:SAM-dependent methyltransferase
MNDRLASEPSLRKGCGSKVATTYRRVSLEYDVDPKRMGPLLRWFTPMEADASTRAWIDRAIDDPQPRYVTVLRNLAKPIVGLYDANGMTGAYSMRVLGTDQWKRLLSAEVHDTLLDVGAGDGEVTAELAPLFRRVVTTELSGPMAKRLRARGWECHEVDLATARFDGTFDTIAMLNVLDRTTFPRALLMHAQKLMAPGGRLVIAVPLPIEQVVFAGSSQLEPEQKLPAGHAWFEDAANAMADFLQSFGMAIEAFTRAPYLCRGDARHPVAVLDDAIFVLKRS